MFEGTLVESQGFAVSATKRWTAVGSVVVQCGIAALLVAIPLLRPEALPLLDAAPRMVVPLPVKPPMVRVKVDAAASSAAAVSLPAASPAPMTMPTLLHGVSLADPGPEPMAAAGIHMGSGMPGGLPGIGDGTAPNVTVARPKAIGPTRVSSGVVSGMLLAPIQPVYPAMAKATRTEGVVVMEATISKTGRIESLRAVSGPAMLRGAAMDAVQAARYAPYQLNGEATEVQTTITVVFRLGS
jgi:periplasmic protein TonB